MLRRNIKITFRLNTKEQQRLKSSAKKQDCRRRHISAHFLMAILQRKRRRLSITV